MNRPVTGKPFSFPWNTFYIIYGGNGHRCRACGENIKQIFRQMPRQSYVGNPIFYFIPVAFYIRHFSLTFLSPPRRPSRLKFHPFVSLTYVQRKTRYHSSLFSTLPRQNRQSIVPMVLLSRGRARKYKGNFSLETGIAMLRVERYSSLNAPWITT